MWVKNATKILLTTYLKKKIKQSILFLLLQRIFIQLNEVYLEKCLLVLTAFNKHDFARGKDSFVISVIKQNAIQFKISIFDLPRWEILKRIKLQQKI